MRFAEKLNEPIGVDTGDDGPARVFAAWQSIGLAEALAPWQPAIVSSLASGLGAAGSDLDVVCDLRAPGFLAGVRAAFGGRDGFKVDTLGPRVVVRFDGDALPVEVVGEALPIEHQQAYRHAVVHRRLVLAFGAPFAAAVRAVRAERGAKTEPAIAEVLGLAGGDAYAAVDALLDASPSALARLWHPPTAG